MGPHTIRIGEAIWSHFGKAEMLSGNSHQPDPTTP
jgi:hypothetical protein